MLSVRKLLPVFRTRDFRLPLQKIVDVERHALALHFGVASEELARQGQSAGVVLEVCEDFRLGARLIVQPELAVDEHKVVVRARVLRINLQYALEGVARRREVALDLRQLSELLKA